ncbi:MAG: anthranilate phosphoribosyltransferase [Alphaproteobacteria bacterium]|nr:anthranilate phosphoribosyltransferase [Alphaproteobacteria bacterium]
MTAPRDLRPVLRRIAAGERLGAGDMRAAIDVIFDGDADDAQVAGFLMGLAARGETPEEIAAAAEAMRARATKVEAPEDVVDTCGTGGDGAGTYNISTAAALIAAGAGARVAKHGNKAASSRSGSSDILASLGVNLDAPPARVSAAITRAGVGFLFAPRHHGATARAAAARAALGARTLFNLLGPLTNPAGARRQLLGVYAAPLVETMAAALARLGATRAMVVHGSDGLDELTTTGPSIVAELNHGEITRYEVAPQQFGLNLSRPRDLAGGAPAANASALQRLLDGEPGAYRDIAVLNAGAALVVAGVVARLSDGVEAAAAAIDDGRARRALETLVAVSNDETIG